LAGRRREVRLARVLEDGQVVAAGDRGQRRHVRGLPVEVHRHDCRGARRDGRERRVRRHRQAFWIDVGEHGRRARHHDRQGGIRGRERRGNDLIARSDTPGTQRERQRVRAGSYADAMAGACGLGEFRLEGLEFGAKDEPASGEDPIDGLAHCAGVFPRRQRHEWHAQAHALAAPSAASMYLAACAR
jgi:hypothetical protein